MAMNLDAVLTIAAKVTGLNDLGALEKGLIGAEKAAGAAKNGFKAMLDSSAWQGAAVAAAGIGVAIGFSVQAALDLEQSINSVRKVVDGIETPQGIAQLKNELTGLSTQFPISAQGFADIYAAAGASGIARNQLRDFAVVVAGVATAFQMTASDAGTALSQISVAVGLTTPEMKELATMMNYLDANSGASATALVEFMTQAGATGKIAGLTAQQTAALGAAMIQGGSQVEVAATSFRNMIKALSAGPSMTDRQVSALGRLGYAVVDAAQLETQWTAAAERQSQQRIAVYRNETDQALNEISRRYRSMEQDINDQFEDEINAYERSLQRRAQAQIDAIQNSETLSESAKRNAIDSIQDQLDRELTEYRRGQRDKQQALEDGLSDRRDIEIKAAEQRFQEQEALEKANLEKEKAAIRLKAQAIADEFKQGFADRLQKEGIGLISEVLNKIANLPESSQISVIKDLFGDESRALPTLIGNISELERLIELTGDKSKAAALFLKELAIQKNSLSGQSQILWNRVKNLAAAIGDSFLPVLRLVQPLLSKLLNEFTYLVKVVPGLGPAIGLIASAFVGLIAVAPFISGFITLLGQIGITGAKIGAIFKGLGAIWFGLKTAFLIAFQPILTWIGSTFIPALIGFFSGPVGWTVLAVAAVVAMVVLFREPIGKFLLWLGNEFNYAMKVLGQVAYDLFVQPFIDLWNNVLRAPIADALAWISNEFEYAMNNLGTVAYDLFVKPWVDLWNNVLRDPVTAGIKWIQDTWQGISKFFTDNVTTPISEAWTTMVEFLPKAMNAIGAKVKSIFTGVVNTIKSALRSVLQFIANAVNSVGANVNKLIGAFNRLPGPDIPFVPKLNVPAFADGGVVNGPTLAMVGEGGEPEYIIPQSKMAAASANYLSGARGGAVIPAFASGGYVGGGNAQINVTTGPVMQQGGQQYVTIADLEKAMRKTADGVYASLRTPAGRYSVGTR